MKLDPFKFRIIPARNVDIKTLSEKYGQHKFLLTFTNQKVQTINMKDASTEKFNTIQAYQSKHNDLWDYNDITDKKAGQAIMGKHPSVTNVKVVKL
tara:strand:- start:1514 stop:1801 length:288 start_codon:yes stop_codon:yes gene_type:complete